MSIISNSNAAKAKHLMGSYSSRGAGVSSGKVSQFYKHTFLQEGDQITNLYYAGRVGSADYLEDLELQQVLPFEKSVVTLHETSPSGISEDITFGIKIDAAYDEEQARYTDYSAKLCGCPGNELDPLQLIDLTDINTYSNILAKWVEENSTTYVVTKIHDREWCDALFTKTTMYYGMNGMNYLNAVYYNHNRTVYDPFFEYGHSALDIASIPFNLDISKDVMLFNEKFLYTLANNPNYAQQFVHNLYTSAEKDITSEAVIRCLVYKSRNFNDNYENQYPCLSVSITLQYTQNNGVAIGAFVDGYDTYGDMIDDIFLIALIKNGHLCMYKDYFNEYQFYSIDANNLFFSYSDSNSFFVNSCYGFVSISRFSSTIYSTYIYTAGRGPITAAITEVNMSVPVSVLNLMKDTSLGAPFIDKDGATFLPLLIISGSGLPSEHPFYGVQVVMAAVDSHFEQDNIPIYNFASYSPSSGSVLVNVKYENETFAITSIQINGTSTPIESFSGAEWEVLVVTRPANITT